MSASADASFAKFAEREGSDAELKTRKPASVAQSGDSAVSRAPS